MEVGDLIMHVAQGDEPTVDILDMKMEKAVELLVTNPHGFYVDGTLGGGSHTHAILNKLTAGGRVAGFDQDMDAIKYSRKKLLSLDHGDHGI